MNESVHIPNNQLGTEISKEKLLNTSQLETKQGRELLKGFLRARLISYGIEDQYDTVEAVVFCESSWNVSPRQNGISWGIAQFTPPTWKDFGHGDIMDPFSQLDVMAKMWTNPKLRNRWDCFSGKR